MKKKPVKVKPSFYSHCFEILKRIALTYGYNLVLHGSMDRDLDMIAIPWEEEVGSVKKMMSQFCKVLGATLHRLSSEKPHGRVVYIIDLDRADFTGHDSQYYLDISVMPVIKIKKGQ